MRIFGAVLIAVSITAVFLIRPGTRWNKITEGHLGFALIPPVILAGIAMGTALLIAG